ncbi:MAG: NlpC/P60 family protein, partial [Sulfurimonas sp.]|nr:NlpC/P60 family protein [Sulfurimonas sp.]
MIRITLIISVLLLFSGCSTKHYRQHSKPKKLQNLTSKPKADPSYKPKKQNWITTALYNEYKKWYRTPYEYGGIDTDGLDCSSLVQIVYRDAFHIDLPRTTKNQVKEGYLISKNSTKEGDLIFFKTGFKKRHAGII